MVRSQAREAAPVVSGRADPTTIAASLGGLTVELALESGLNPYVELLEAKRIRDVVCHRFLVKPAGLVGFPAPESRSQAAQMEMVRRLIDRGWWIRMIDAYLETTGSARRYLSFCADASVGRPA